MSYITYFSSGRLGDFIFNLSIVNEVYLATNKKGIVFIDNQPTSFQYTIDQTYDELLKIINGQNYIHEFKIYDGLTSIDINLDSWRNSPHLNENNNYHEMYEKVFGIQWGIHPWINLPKDDKYKDFILVCHSDKRSNIFISKSDFIRPSLKNVYFATTDIQEYIRVKDTLKIPPLIFNSLYDFCIALNSCKLIISNMSAPLCFAFAFHKEVIAILPNENHFHMIDLKRVIKMNKSFLFYNWIINHNVYSSSIILNFFNFN